MQVYRKEQMMKMTVKSSMTTEFFWLGSLRVTSSNIADKTDVCLINKNKKNELTY